MAVYTPDCWAVLEISDENGFSHYRILCSFYGGYLGSDSWKISSGFDCLSEISETTDYYSIPQSSGSLYKLHKGGDRFSGVMLAILESLNKSVEGTFKSIKVISTC